MSIVNTNQQEVQKCCTSSKTVYLHSFFLGNSFVDEELGHVLALVALKLDDLAKFWVFYNSTITTKILREMSKEMEKRNKPS